MKTAHAAAIMNFLVWGSGYLYMRKAWGFWFVLLDVFVTAYVAASVQLVNDLRLNLFFVLISILFAWHGYKLAKKVKRKQ